MDVDLKRPCLELARTAGLMFEAAAFAFLPRDVSGGTRVYVTACEGPGRFFAVHYEFYKMLESLNDDITAFLDRMEAQKLKGNFIK